MKILLVGYKNGHQATRFGEESKKIGVEVVGINTTQLILEFTDKSFTYRLRGCDYKLEDFDLIYLGVSGDKRRWEWLVVCDYLSRKHGVKIVNNKFIDTHYNVYFTPASEYEKQVENNINFPASTIIFNKNSLKEIKGKFNFPVIVKVGAPGFGRKGKGVFKVESMEDFKKLIDETKDFAHKYIVREFIPNDGDIRVFTVGYKVIGAMKRTPKAGDFKSNISQGAQGCEFDLTGREDIVKMAETMSRITQTEIAGVDIILNKDTGKPYVLEVNSNPQFKGLEEYTSTNAAKKIIEYFVSLVE